MKNHALIFPSHLYTEYLLAIDGIKFTPREIDIISCLVQGKGLKGIARFLSSGSKQISDRSVETHILNIRRKIGGGSRESIIDFLHNLRLSTPNYIFQ
ncbi:MAG: helix-turn-helix transcriptional regulator, partial [Pseudomonadota bacterium]